MSTDPYTLTELPGVIKELRRLDTYEGVWAGDVSGIREGRKSQLWEMLPRLLATVEAMAADAAYGRDCREWEEAVDNAIAEEDAARKDQP